ncbi:MAG TPA: universal stress protein [Nitrososphaeraceae archaeon]|jgi:nucleotide-binding universal stress UspA family protein|nr:universal stress protein [Nitrososphaeraceae archaeon]
MALKKILIPYDGSKQSDKALSSAIEISTMARKACEDTQLILFHVVPEIVVPPSYYASDYRFSSQIIGEKITTKEYLKELYQRMKVEATGMLERKIEDYQHDRELSVKSKVTIGRPADRIIEFAVNEKVDLIVMGTSGLKGISRIKALGSVARGVSERAPCSVMLVH